MIVKLSDRRLWLGIGISICCLLFLVRSVNGTEVLRALSGINGWYLIPAVAVTFLGYFVRALRWRYLLVPLKRASLANLYSATLIGYMANNLLPARLGEFVRAYALADREQLESSSVFATLVLDRLTDGFTVLLLLLVTVFTLHLPASHQSVQEGLFIGGYATLALYVAVIFFLVLLKKNTLKALRFLEWLLRPFPARFASKLIPLLGSFLEGVKLSSVSADRWGIVLSSLVIWGLAIVPIDLTCRAFGLFLPLPVSAFILVLLVFAVMVPASPGFVGTYHAACVYGLVAFGVSREEALSVAIVIHGINFFPVIIAGLYSLWRAKLSLGTLGEKASHE